MPTTTPPLDRAAGLTEVCRRVRLLPGDQTRWIGVDGFGAAGKTSFVDALSTMISGSVVVHVDDFARPGVGSWDHHRFADELLGPLLAGRTATYRVWDWDTDRAVASHRVTPGQVLIIEGVSSTDTAVGVPWDLTVWLEASAAVRWERVLARDQPTLLPIWRDEWIPSEMAYAHRQRPRERADLVISGEDADSGD